MEDIGWFYSDTVKDHFTNPRNVLHQGEEFKEDGEGYVGNPQCGDVMRMLIKVEKKNNHESIKDCRWQTYGCASAIGSTSILSEMIIGSTLEDALKITPNEIIKKLGGLPPHKIHCSVLGDKALRSAIYDYWRRTNQSDKIPVQEKKIICKCLNVTDEEIEHLVLEGVKDFRTLQERTKISTACGKCRPQAEETLNKYLKKYNLSSV